MVLLDSIVGIANSLLGFISLPDILTQPVVSHIYADIAFIAVFALVILISKLLVFKRLFLALLISLILSIVVGGVYFATLALLAQIIFIVIWHFIKFRKKDELGGDMGGADLGKMGGEDFGKIGGEENLEMPKAEEFKETGMPEVTPGMPEVEHPKQKLCPYCHNPLRYIQQYQKYYCDYCKQYR
jgi:hypothetical protein